MKNTAAAADMPEEPAAPQQGQGGAATGPLANYEIQRRIGSGKFSVVYKARKLKDNSVCALKKVQVFDIKDAKVCTAACRPAALCPLGCCAFRLGVSV